ncbi:putative FAD-dependent monooxygenase [Colletotrichum spaethianum]|uniref:FAD-dependent monooxygenase n=1 Tax=Colletotrichum spaethianum TaxID=700344 RepID=A0AA37L4V8_9PEZI|nr:putative FAD-dependent monooxygenase [Colletotrichum spaethianum]GKT40260.1 putative FAD-dependent monooxygenase [Colletotrichum spaethianum]
MDLQAEQLPVIIIGAGIVGLTLAQSLKKDGVPFVIYERDASSGASEGGWGITVHWGLSAFESCLPPSLFHRLLDIQVDPEQGRKDTGKFLFLDLATAEPRFSIPASKRLRINRRKLRNLLTTGMNVHWNKTVKSFDTSTPGQVSATFEDGTIALGSVIVGADGSSSRTRRLLLGLEKAKLSQLPLRFAGVTMRMTPEEVKPLRDIDPLLFQGSHADTHTFLWYSTLSTPEVNGSSGAGEYFEGQLNMSWPVKSEADEVPQTHRDRVTKMKAMAEPFEARLKAAVESIPDDSQVLEIKLQDWPTQAWDNYQGRVTLVGDAAHAMTMYRGEAFNHGITDAARLSEQLIEAHQARTGYERAVESYESEMRPRTRTAVLLSRQACLDAHDLNALTPDSPLVSKRAIILEPATIE